MPLEQFDGLTRVGLLVQLMGSYHCARALDFDDFTWMRLDALRRFHSIDRCRAPETMLGGTPVCSEVLKRNLPRQRMHGVDLVLLPDNVHKKGKKFSGRSHDVVENSTARASSFHSASQREDRKSEEKLILR